MGLAASQARLLTITARKADCEFQSMSLSHQKIALSRDMEKISDEYQKAMNKTKLVYDYYGSGTSQMNLNYGLLMSPSVYNDYYPKLITDNTNRVELSDKYADAAKKAGIPIEGYNGTPSSEVRNKFVEALRDNSTITPTTASNIQSVSYNNAVGLGKTISAQETTMDVTYKDLLEMIKANCADTSDYGMSFDFSKGGVLRGNGSDKPENLENGLAYPDSTKLNCSFSYATLKQVDGNSDLTSLSLYDLLTKDKDYIFSLTRGNRSNNPSSQMLWMQQFIVGTENTPSFLNWMTDQFSAVLGGVSANNLALQYAYDQVYDIIYPNENLQNAGKDNEDVAHAILEEVSIPVANCWKSDKTGDVRREAEKYIGMVHSFSKTKSHSKVTHANRRQSTVAVDLSKLAQVFLTAYVEYQNGIENSTYSYEQGQNKNGSNGRSQYSLYDANDDDIFKIKGPTDVDTGNSSLEAGFYDTLFNLICTHGWTENDNITDPDYMQELLKSGAVYISSIDNDGCYYQNSYSTDTYISEIPDQEGIAQAESKYNAEKAKIERKENTIDMKMKNLDTEISSLTTEYDTMKNVISKSIEKSFKRYEA